MTKKKIKRAADYTEEEEELMYNAEDEYGYEYEDEDEDEDEDEVVDEVRAMEKEAEKHMVYSFATLRKMRWSPRMELFSVHIKLNVGESLNNLFGTITAVDAIGSQDIFHAKSGVTFESKTRPGWSQLLLNGLHRQVESYDDPWILMRLTKNRDAIEADKKLPSRWYMIGSWDGITWNPNNWGKYGCELHRPLTKCFHTDFGMVSMEYALMGSALGALVEVTLLNNNNNVDAADVYGSITARTTNFKGCERVLFHKTKLDAVEVEPGETIPLTRTSVCGQLDSRLVIYFDLWNHSSNVPSCIDNDELKICTRFVSSSINKPKVEEKTLLGNYGAIKVKVTWVII